MFEPSHTLCLIGPQPPPRHGVSSVNEAVREMAEAAGLGPVCLNTAPASLARSLRVRLGRIQRIWDAWRQLRLHTRRGPSVVYLSLSGGLGLVWEALFSWQARRAGARVVVHHHSFHYLNESYWPMRLLVGSAGRDALHVVLGSVMGQALQARYAGVGSILVLSNAVFVGAPLVSGKDRFPIPRSVGLLANLSTAKGLDDFLALAELSETRQLPWRFVLAGPFENEADGITAKRRIQTLKNIDYRGPLYGEAKSAFLAEIDVFIFPTRYRHEAEPLVVLEALRQGCPVIAFGRGCIPEMLGDSGGQVIPVGGDFVNAALATMESWRNQGNAFQRRVDSARLRFAELHAQGSRALDMLLVRFGKNHS
jgi:glycosyltransferase involved in cell wall biosynthesis